MLTFWQRCKRTALQVSFILAASCLPLLLEVLVAALWQPFFWIDKDDVLVAGGIVLGTTVLGWIVGLRFGVASGAVTGFCLSLWPVITLHIYGWLYAVFSRFGEPGTNIVLMGQVLLAAALCVAIARALAPLFAARFAPILLLSVSFALLPFMIRQAMHPPDSRSAALRNGSPDVIVLVLDTARHDHFSVYGYSRATTPKLAKFATGGRVYENAWSPAPWTPPAHASLLTGLLPAQHNHDSGHFQVRDLLLSEVFQQAGYRTAAVVNNPNLGSGWDRGFEVYGKIWQPSGFTLGEIRRRLVERHESSRFVGNTRRSLQWIRRWWSQHGEEPRFVFLNLIDPHDPYGDGHEFMDMFLDHQTRDAKDLSNNARHYRLGRDHAIGPGLRKLIARYDGDIFYMDQLLGKFFDWLERRGELDETIFVITSDHGERLGERGLMGHQLGLEEVLLRVPLILRYPPQVAPARVTTPVQTHGVFDTVIELAGIPAPDSPLPRMPALDRQQGRVIVSQLKHQAWYLKELQDMDPEFDVSAFDGDWTSVSDGRWKLVVSDAGLYSLFDLENDPREERNVAGDHGEVMRELRRVVDLLPGFPDEAEMTDFHSPSDQVPKALSPEAEKALRSLGYIQ